jgi:hypothetical protein
MRVLTDSEVGEAGARLVERRRTIDGRASGTRGNPNVSRRERLQGPEAGIHTGRVGSYSGQGVTVELGNPPALPPLRGADGRSDRRTREAGAEPA